MSTCQWGSCAWPCLAAGGGLSHLLLGLLWSLRVGAWLGLGAAPAVPSRAPVPKPCIAAGLVAPPELWAATPLGGSWSSPCPEGGSPRGEQLDGASAHPACGPCGRARRGAGLRGRCEPARTPDCRAPRDPLPGPGTACPGHRRRLGRAFAVVAPQGRPRPPGPRLLPPCLLGFHVPPAALLPLLPLHVEGGAKALRRSHAAPSPKMAAQSRLPASNRDGRDALFQDGCLRPQTPLPFPAKAPSSVTSGADWRKRGDSASDWPVARKCARRGSRRVGLAARGAMEGLQLDEEKKVRAWPPRPPPPTRAQLHSGERKGAAPSSPTGGTPPRLPSPRAGPPPLPALLLPW